jgi:hypothetical protein
MNSYVFEYSEDTNLIIVIGIIDGYEVRLAVDTGASDTVIDLTALMIAGYRKNNVVANVELETAKGIVTADVFEVRIFEAFGIRKEKMLICSYDLLMNNVLTDIDGVLGLDFFQDRKFCIDLKNKELTIQA